MNNFSHIIFDLDGTLTDNTLGISKSMQYALEKMNIGGYSEEVLKKYVGPPLQYCFRDHFGLNEKETALAVDYFREYYGEKGWAENKLYPGVPEMLEELHSSGKQLFIATSKLGKFARMVLQNFDLQKYITDMEGADYGGTHSKGDLIRAVMNRNGIQPGKQVIMVGDTIFDIQGARESKIPVTAVSYGFGEKEELLAMNPDFYAENVGELHNILV